MGFENVKLIEILKELKKKSKIQINYNDQKMSLKKFLLKLYQTLDFLMKLITSLKLKLKTIY